VFFRMSFLRFFSRFVSVFLAALAISSLLSFVFVSLLIVCIVLFILCLSDFHFFDYLVFS
jgi:hypothetical protein